MPNITSPKRIHIAIQPTRDATPKYPQYVKKKKRVETFVTWPDDSPVQPEELADAGETDSVRCFQCGGECRNWKDGDRPFLEHIRLHPHCSYHRLTNVQDRADLRPTQNAEPSMQNQESDVVSPKYPQCVTEQQQMEACATRSEGSIESRFACGDAIKPLEEDTQSLGTHSKQYPSSPNILRKTQQVLDTGQDIRRQLSNYFSQGVTRNCNRPTNMVDPRDQEPRSDTQTETNLKSELESENQRLKDTLGCKLCLRSDCSAILLPCGHFCICLACAQGIGTCFICKQAVEKIVIPKVD